MAARIASDRSEPFSRMTPRVSTGRTRESASVKLRELLAEFYVTYEFAFKLPASSDECRRLKPIRPNPSSLPRRARRSNLRAVTLSTYKQQDIKNKNICLPIKSRWFMLWKGLAKSHISDTT